MGFLNSEKSDIPINPGPSCQKIPKGIMQKDIPLFRYSLTNTIKPNKNKDTVKNNDKSIFTITTDTQIQIPQPDLTFQTVSETTNITEKPNESLVLSVDIDPFEFNLNQISIPDVPTVMFDCHECENEDTIPSCGGGTGWKKKCKKIFGKKMCVYVPTVNVPNKCLFEIFEQDISLPNKKIIDFKKLKILVDIEFLPELEIESEFTLGITGTVSDIGSIIKAAIASTTNGLQAGASGFAEMKIPLLKIAVSIFIKRIEITYNGKGLIIENEFITIIPKFDFCGDGRYFTSTVNTEGEINLFYMIDNRDFILYYILEPLLEKIRLRDMNALTTLALYQEAAINEIFGTNFDMSGALSKATGGKVNLDDPIIKYIPNFILHLLKQIKINNACGILLCPMANPAEPNFLSIWDRATVRVNLFEALRVKPLKVPTDIAIKKISTDRVPRAFKSLINPANKIIDNLNKGHVLNEIMRLLSAANDQLVKRLQNIKKSHTQAIPIIPKTPA